MIEQNFKMISNARKFVDTVLLVLLTRTTYSAEIRTDTRTSTTYSYYLQELFAQSNFELKACSIENVCTEKLLLKIKLTI